MNTQANFDPKILIDSKSASLDQEAGMSEALTEMRSQGLARLNVPAEVVSIFRERVPNLDLLVLRDIFAPANETMQAAIDNVAATGKSIVFKVEGQFLLADNESTVHSLKTEMHDKQFRLGSYLNEEVDQARVQLGSEDFLIQERVSGGSIPQGLQLMIVNRDRLNALIVYRGNGFVYIADQTTSLEEL